MAPISAIREMARGSRLLDESAAMQGASLRVRWFSTCKIRIFDLKVSLVGASMASLILAERVSSVFLRRSTYRPGYTGCQVRCSFFRLPIGTGFDIFTRIASQDWRVRRSSRQQDTLDSSSLFSETCWSRLPHHSNIMSSGTATPAEIFSPRFWVRIWGSANFPCLKMEAQLR